MIHWIPDRHTPAHEAEDRPAARGAAHSWLLHAVTALLVFAIVYAISVRTRRESIPPPSNPPTPKATSSAPESVATRPPAVAAPPAPVDPRPLAPPDEAGALANRYRTALIDGDEVALAAMREPLAAEMPAVIRHLRDAIDAGTDLQTLRELAHALLMLRSEEALTATRELIARTPEGEFKEYLIENLRNGIGPEIGPRYVEMLLSPEDARFIEPVRRALADMTDEGTARRVVAAWEETSDAEKRTMLASILSSVKSEATVPALAEAIRDNADLNTRPELIRAAASGLANLGTERSLEALIGSWGKALNEEAKRAILDAYENLRGGTNPEFISRMLTGHANPRVRIASVRALLNVEGPQAREALEKALTRESDSGVKTALEEGLRLLDQDGK